MTNDFSISAYFDRIEQANLEIIAKREPPQKAIVLWWGFDGLQINTDGSFKWIKRENPKPEPSSAGCLYRQIENTPYLVQRQVQTLNSLTIPTMYYQSMSPYSYSYLYNHPYLWKGF